MLKHAATCKPTWRLLLYCVGTIILVSVIIHILVTNTPQREGFLGELLPIPSPSKNLTAMETEYKKYEPKFRTISADDPNYTYDVLKGTGSVCDYYIASSYNSACGGYPVNDYLGTGPLKVVIAQGARVLDFEIYYMNNDAVVGSSGSDSIHAVGSNNTLPVGGSMGVLSTIVRFAFSSRTSPNPTDPLFIHFRIKSEQKELYDKLALHVKKQLAPRLLNATYGYQGRANAPSGGKNLARESLLKLKNKIVIMCEDPNNGFVGTPFEEYVNLSNQTPYLQQLRNHAIQYTHDPKGLENFNKSGITLTMPDLSNGNSNVSGALHFSYGCQMVCMNYPNLDSNMKHYLDKFDKAGTAFILKPKAQRNIPVTVPVPPPQNPALSLAPKAIDLPMYKASI